MLISKLFHKTLLGLVAVALFAPTVMANDQIPAGPQKTPIVLVDGTVHPISSEAIEGG